MLCVNFLIKQPFNIFIFDYIISDVLFNIKSSTSNSVTAPPPLISHPSGLMSNGQEETIQTVSITDSRTT